MATYWLIAAAESLRAVAHGQALADPAAAERLFARIDDTLAQVFPGQVVIVRDRLSGYRPFDGLAILLVEIQPSRAPACLAAPPSAPATPDPAAPASSAALPGATSPVASAPPIAPGPFHSPGIYIVKIAFDGRAADLKREIDAWDAARPAHLRSDNIFVSLDPFPPRESGRPPIALVYGDANTVLGSRNVMTLEEAVFRACEFGQPRPQSIGRLFHSLYERLDLHFFRRSTPCAPASYLADTARPRLDSLLFAWQEARPDGQPSSFESAAAWAPELDIDERRRLRREALALLSAEHASYADPIDYFAGVWRVRGSASPLAPNLHRGFAHGDMHARNIQVSLVDDDISQSAVFDYEQMRPDNFIAWDFIKMELELAVRLLDAAGLSDRLAFVDQTLTFWRFIAARIDEFDRHSAAAPDDDLETVDAKILLPLDPQLARKVATLPGALFRLAGGIIALRRIARRYLGSDSMWEYDFLLAWYACRAALYPNYGPRMVTAALVAAGVSARRLMRRSPEGPTPDRLPREVSHRPRFLYARRLARSGEASERDEGVRRLEELRQDYPHALEIDEELSLVYIEQRNYAAAEDLLESLFPQRYQHTTAELPSRLGAVWKRKALAEQPPNARFLRRSLDCYRQAELIRHDYFPAINVATLQWLLGERTAAREQARQVLASLDVADLSSDPFWPLATRGEALLLLGDEIDEALRCYGRAAADRDCTPRDRASMRRQLECLRSHLDADVQARLTDDVLEGVFGEGAEGEVANSKGPG